MNAVADSLSKPRPRAVTIVIGTLLAVLIYLQRARLSERFGRAA
jgi:hypothetical protein